MADNKENAVPVIEQPGPSKVEQILKWLKVAGIILGIIVSGVLGVAASGGLALPPAAIAVLNSILGLLAAAGLASNGIQKAPPRVGPPEP
jgi:hypothetical protein